MKTADAVLTIGVVGGALSGIFGLNSRRELKKAIDGSPRITRDKGVKLATAIEKQYPGYEICYMYLPIKPMESSVDYDSEKKVFIVYLPDDEFICEKILLHELGHIKDALWRNSNGLPMLRSKKNIIDNLLGKTVKEEEVAWGATSGNIRKHAVRSYKTERLTTAFGIVIFTGIALMIFSKDEDA